MIIPKDITQDVDSGLQIASFDYNLAIRKMKEKNYKQVVSFTDLKPHSTFIVCCGDIMTIVNDEDYPSVKRRII